MNLNRVFFGGHLTRSPEMKYTASKMAIANFGVACNRKVKDKPDEVCFIDVAAFGKTAELINQHLGKGDPILIEGRLNYRQWESKDRKKQSKLEVVVDQFHFVGGKKGKSDPDPGGARGQDAPAAQDDDLPF